MCCLKCCGKTQRMVWVFGGGGLLLILGIVTVILWPSFIRQQIRNSYPLSEKSKTFDQWAEIPIPIYMDVFLFNWTNPEQVRDKSVKPDFKEIGPFVFLENRRKDDLVWNDNKTISFWNTRTWHFKPELSGASMDVMVTCPNMISASVAHTYRNKPRALKFFMNPMLNEYGSLTRTKTAAEWIFDGFEDPLIELAEKFNISSAPPVDKFGWFYGRNGSKEYEGRFTIRTGQDDVSALGDLTFWNGKQNTGFYEGECGNVNGSTGDIWPPDMDVSKGITMFSTDLCRGLNLAPGPTASMMGIEGVKFRSMDWSLGNKDKYPNMDCFCPKDSDECPKTGVLDVSECRYGSPVYVSFPHFYMAHESYREAISGMVPNEDEHRFVFLMEPTMAIPMNVTGAFQVNLELKSDNVFTLYKNLPKFLAPMLWMRQRGGIDEDLAKQVKLALSLPAIGVYVGIGITTVASLMILIGIYLTIAKKWVSEELPHEELEEDKPTAS